MSPEELQEREARRRSKLVYELMIGNYLSRDLGFHSLSHLNSFTYEWVLLISNKSKLKWGRIIYKKNSSLKRTVQMDQMSQAGRVTQIINHFIQEKIYLAK